MYMLFYLPTGLPMASVLEIKSNKSSTSWNAMPKCFPYWNALSTKFSSAPPKIATPLQLYAAIRV